MIQTPFFSQAYSTDLLLWGENLFPSSHLSAKVTEVFLTDRSALPLSLDASKSCFRKFPREPGTLLSRKS